MFISILLLAHFQAAFIPILLGIRSINKFKHISKNKFIASGFIFLGLDQMSEEPAKLDISDEMIAERRGAPKKFPMECQK